MISLILKIIYVLGCEMNYYCEFDIPFVVITPFF